MATEDINRRDFLYILLQIKLDRLSDTKSNIEKDWMYEDVRNIQLQLKTKFI